MQWCLHGYVTGIAAAYSGQLLHLGCRGVAATKCQLQVSSIRLAFFLQPCILKAVAPCVASK